MKLGTYGGVVYGVEHYCAAGALSMLPTEWVYAEDVPACCFQKDKGRIM